VGTASAVSALLNTDFHVAKSADAQYLIRAGDYSLPAAVDAAVATVFGLHGLPLPRNTRQARAGADPASVDPSVIYSTYKVTKQTVRRSSSNRQAVAEFQGQFMNSTDLKALFAKYVGTKGSAVQQRSMAANSVDFVWLAARTMHTHGGVHRACACVRT